MEINEAGLALIKQFEGLALTAYRCPADVPTIGYGHTRTVTDAHVRSGYRITEEAAEALLRDDLREAERAVEGHIQRPMTPNEFAAMVSLAFNIGAANFRSSSVARLFNDGDKVRSARAFELWNKITVSGKKVVSAGLVRRRAAEAALFLKAE